MMKGLLFLLVLPFLTVTQQGSRAGRTGQPLEMTMAQEERVYIPGGEFIMGSTSRELEEAMALCRADTPGICEQIGFAAESPPHRVRTSAYFISRTEVDNASYERCVRAGSCVPRTQHQPDPRFDGPRLPAVNVTWDQAERYCGFLGGRLPTEAEWERAARGSSPRTFPWGQLWNGSLCNHGRGITPQHDDSDGYRYLAPVDAFPAARSPFGLLNMAGNAAEWVADWYSEGTYSDQDHGANPTGPRTGAFKVIRGGSWALPSYAMRVAMRAIGAPEGSIEIGFRCAWDH